MAVESALPGSCKVRPLFPRGSNAKVEDRALAGLACGVARVGLLPLV